MEISTDEMENFAPYVERSEKSFELTCSDEPIKRIFFAEAKKEAKSIGAEVIESVGNYNMIIFFGKMDFNQADIHSIMNIYEVFLKKISNDLVMQRIKVKRAFDVLESNAFFPQCRPSDIIVYYTISEHDFGNFTIDCADPRSIWLSSFIMPMQKDVNVLEQVKKIAISENDYAKRFDVDVVLAKFDIAMRELTTFFSDVIPITIKSSRR